MSGPGPSREHADVAIIGAGITGLSIAWQLSQRGVRNITTLDKVGIGAGATAIQPGGVRQQWGTEVMCHLAREAYEFYKSFEERLDVDVSPHLTDCGYFFVARSDRELERLRELVALQNGLGIGSEILSPKEAGEVVPGLDSSAIAGGSYCANDGYFDRPLAVVAGFEIACRRSGVDFVDRGVTRVTRDGEGFELELGGGATLLAEHVVLAAGYDSLELAAQLGYELPIEKEAKYLFYSEPIRERLLEPLVTSQENHFASKQLADGSVLASDLSASGDPDSNRKDWYAHIRRMITSLLPILEYVTFPVLVEGFYDTTPDRQPILGPLDPERRIWSASGLNGRGLMLAPAISRTIADAMTSTGSDPQLEKLSLERFAENRLLPESHIV